MARNARHQVRAGWLVFVALEYEPMRLKHSREVFCTGALSAGWVHRLKPDQLLGKRNGIDAHNSSEGKCSYSPLNAGLRFSLKARMPSR